ncbi:MAG: enoyl-CoA hydratase/isomerase family protein [Smithellaceae bacterium]
MNNFKAITFEKKDGIGLLTLNRPDRLNAFTPEMAQEMITVFDGLIEDNECRVVIITGKGKAFCAGADLKQLSDFDYSDLKGRTVKFWQIQKKSALVIEKMRQIPQPIIAAVNGVAMGGGMCFSLPADIRIASKSAKFCAAFINVGMTATDMGSSYFLPRIVGLTRASEIMFTGRFVGAEEALRIGLVTQVTEDSEIVDVAMGIAKVMLEKSVLGLILTKEAINHSYNNSLEGMTCIENRNQTLAGLSGSWEEALNKFLKR